MNLTLDTAKEMMARGGGSLYLRGTGIAPSKRKRVIKLRHGDYTPGRWVYADGILTHIKKEKRIDKYTFYVGRIPGRNVIFDGINYAHCDTLRSGISDLLFKSASDRGAEQYRGLSLDTEMGVDDAVAMYRIITGACAQGSKRFVEDLGDKLKERYTIREMLELTRGQYGSESFEKFFGEQRASGVPPTKGGTSRERRAAVWMETYTAKSPRSGKPCVESTEE